MKNKTKISSILIGSVFASLLLVNFALAQTGTPATQPASTSTVVTIPPQEILDAQNSPEACRKFRKDIQIIWPGQAKAIWSIDVIGASYKPCRIVPANYPDWLDVALKQPSGLSPDGLYSRNLIIGIPKEFKDIQTQIQNGKGVSSDVVAAAAAKAVAAKTTSGPISVIVGEVLVFIFGVINAVLASLAALAGGIFNSAVNPILHITDMPTIVTTGWVIIRDVCNMFFIIVLIIMALATILRVGEEYNYKHLLPKLVLMALLVNFSLVISVTIMNAVNFLAAVFWSGPNVDLWHLFAVMVKIANPVGDFGIVVSGGTPAALALGLGRLVFILVTTVVFIALAGLFIIRLVGLYVLIIFSPIAYVANILPATEKYSEEWWSHFLKYLIWAPVALFMLRLVILVVDDNSQFNLSGGGSHDSVFVFFILTAFMAAAFLVAQEAGMVGSEMVINGVKGGLAFAGGRALGYAGRKYNEATSHLVAGHEGQKVSTARRVLFALANPVAAVKGWNERSEELKHHAQEVAAARGRETMDTLMTGTTLPHAQIAERHAENEKVKLLIDMKKEQLMSFLQDAEKIKGHEGETTRLAAMKAALSNGFMDDVLRMNHFAEKYGEVVKDENGDENVVLSSPDTIQRFLRGYLGNGEQSMRFVAEDMEEAGKKTNHAEYLGHAYFDPDSKSFKYGMEVAGTGTNARGETIDTFSDDEKKNHQASYSAGEWEKLTPNQLSTTAPHAMAPQLAKIKRDAQGRAQIITGENGETGQNEIKDITWGPASITPSSQLFYKGITNLVGEERVIDRFQNVQVRTKDRLLTKGIDATGQLEIKNLAELKKIVALWNNKPDLAKALYAQKLNIPLKHRKDITNLRIKYSGPDITLSGVTYTSGMQGFIDPSAPNVSYADLIKNKANV